MRHLYHFLTHIKAIKVLKALTGHQLTPDHFKGYKNTAPGTHIVALSHSATCVRGAYVRGPLRLITKGLPPTGGGLFLVVSRIV
jgi:hypothetical protein